MNTEAYLASMAKSLQDISKTLKEIENLTRKTSSQQISESKSRMRNTKTVISEQQMTEIERKARNTIVESLNSLRK